MLIDEFTAKGIGLYLDRGELKAMYLDGLLDERDLTTIRSHKQAIVAHLARQDTCSRSEPQIKALVAKEAAAGCGALHIQPEKWIQRDGKGYCPRCGRFKGCL